MLNNKGFTLLESLMVLSIVVIVSSMLLNYHRFQLDDTKILKQIELGIYEAKLNSMVYKEKTTIQFQSSYIYITSDHFNKNIKIRNTMFQSKKFSFNLKGHINKGGHVDFKMNNKDYRIKFYLGSGNFEYE